MKKNLLSGLLVIGLITISINQVSAQSIYHSKAEILSELTGNTTEEIYKERENAKTYGEIAKEEDVLEEFKEKNLENTRKYLEEKTIKGEITEEESTQIMENIEEYHQNCDGTGNGRHHNNRHNNNEHDHQNYNYGRHGRR
ncbi:MAG: hypothetical protein HFJ38_04050 [Bacilli bacterium]|nr:hypothetical protein [Bacilli bacterium]